MTIETPIKAASGDVTSPPSRTAAWLPWVAVGVLTAIVIGTFAITDNSGAVAEPPYPHHHLDDPYLPWLWAFAFPIAWVTLLIFFAVQTIRDKKFSMPAMLFVSGTTMFWIEWPADWGSYLVYNRDFWNFTGWTSTWYQTYTKPVNVVFGYGIFFAVECIILLKLVPKVSGVLQRAVPKAPPTAMLIVSAMAVFYMVDILGERLMTVAGWYSYVDAVGPKWESAHGTISFVWPAIPFVLFAVIITLALREDPWGNYPNEKFFKVHTLTPGWRREFARLAVWIVTMNAALFIAQPLILCVGRALFLHDSIYVP